MKTYAQIVFGLIQENSPQAVTLEMGYMVTRTHARVNFSDHYGDGSWDPPRVSKRLNNRRGRCSGTTVEYSDGSRLQFTWSESRGPRYKVMK